MYPNREEMLFQLALMKPASERAAFLERECGEDKALRQRLKALLAAHDVPETALDKTDSAAKGTMKIEFADELPDETVGQKIGRYKILEKVGEGGCGVVYVAEQTEPVRRRVALKVIKLGMDTKQVVARFEAERQALAMMDHPNIAKVLDAGTTDTGRPYFIMELVRGIKITDYCDQEKVPTRERLELFIKVCQAIQHAHQKGIIHRDIKPSNILVMLHDGIPVPKVIDFGIAKATEGRLTEATVYTQLHQFIGTPAYMSPEQAEMSGLDIDTRSDIYSLGVLLYELLTGKTPFDGQELMSQGIDAMRKTIREKEPVRPSTKLATLQGEELTTTARRRSVESSKLAHLLRGDLDWIVMKCLEKDRSRRYDTANGLAMDINRHLTNEPVVARPPSPLYRFQKMVRRNKTASLATAGIVTALAIGIGLAMTALMQKNAAKQRELDQSVRADTVTTFMNSLLSDTLPVMLRQGNSKGARELVNTADRLATSSLSNAPAAEVELRYRLLMILGMQFNDYQAARRQADLISGLLSKVSDDQLKRPREQIRFYIVTTHLWSANGQQPAMEKAMQELEDLYVEFMAETPPAKFWAANCRALQGVRFAAFQKPELAEEKLAAAYDLLSRNVQEAEPERYQIAGTYALVLNQVGNLTRSEKIARENLKLSHRAGPETRTDYLRLVRVLGDTLCKQDRFGEALQMLEEQRRMLAASGGSEADLLQVDALRGDVLARSGKAREALKVLAELAANPLSDAENWRCAAILAEATPAHETYRELCRIGVLRFASTAQGITALAVADGLLAGPTDEMTLSLARGMVERIVGAQDTSQAFAALYESRLALREHRYAEALVLLDKFLGEAPNGFARAISDSSPAIQPGHRFTRARLCAELGRMEEARQEFARGRAELKRALGEDAGHDRGDNWQFSYRAESWRREAEAVFKAKRVPLPDEDAK